MAAHRISLEGNGFITDALKKRLLGRPGINRGLIEVVISTVRFANDLAANLDAYAPHETPVEKQRVVALIILVRLLEIVESMVILAAYGVRQELQTLFRVFLDAYFLLANVCSDPEFVPVYMRTDGPERLKLLNAATKHDHPLFAELNDYNTEEVRTELGQRIKDENIQAFSSFVFAKNVGCAHVYDSMYRLASASVHSAPRCLVDYVDADAEGNIKRVFHKGDVETTHRVLYDTASLLLKVISGVCEAFGVSHTTILKQFEVSLESAMVEHENPNLRSHAGEAGR